MNKQVKWTGIVIAAVALSWVLFKAFRQDDKATRVTVGEVTDRTIVETVSGQGKLYPETEVRITPESSGEITRIYVQEGDTVKKGQLLVQFSSQSMMGLMGGGTTTRTISSPIAGIVTSLGVKEGERVVGTLQMAGTEIMRIANLSSWVVKTEINENDVVKVANGDSALVYLDAYDRKTFKGVVMKIVNSTPRSGMAMMQGGDMTSYEVQVKLDASSYAALLNNTGGPFPFRAGMNARAEIITSRKDNVIGVPYAAVTTRGHMNDSTREEGAKARKKAEAMDEDPSSNDNPDEVVFVVKGNDEVEKRVVTTGIRDMNFMEVISGLKKGERVVTGPNGVVNRDLKTGTKIKIVSKEELFQE